MKLLVTALALLVPAYLYTRFVWSIDRYEKEPPVYLCLALLWGAVPAVIAAIVLQLIFSVPVTLLFGSNSFAGELTQAALGAPVTEEILKGVGVAILFLTVRREFDGWVDGMVYGATVGFGFAYIENIFYLMGTATWEEWTALFVFRAIVFGGLHGFWTALTGIGFGLARYSKELLVQIFVISGGLLLAILGHVVHNAAATLVEVTNGSSISLALLNYAALSGVIIGLSWVAATVDRARLKEYLRDEVPMVISERLYWAICDRHHRQKLAALGIAREHQKTLLQLVSELAQKKLQLAKMGNESGNYAEIQRLRMALREFIG